MNDENPTASFEHYVEVGEVIKAELDEAIKTAIVGGTKRVMARYPNDQRIIAGHVFASLMSSAAYAAEVINDEQSTMLVDFMLASHARALAGFVMRMDTGEKDH